jgi:site-specific recombinase XerD
VKVQAAFDVFLADPRRKLITRSKYSYKLAPFLERHGGLTVTAVTTGVINSWFGEMEQRYAEATLAMTRSCLVTFMGFCVDQGWLTTNPAKQLPHYDGRPKRVVTADEEHLGQALTICGFLSRGLNPRDRRDAAIFSLAAISGARRSNIVNLPFRETVAALARPGLRRAGGQHLPGEHARQNADRGHLWRVARRCAAPVAGSAAVGGG